MASSKGIVTKTLLGAPEIIVLLGVIRTESLLGAKPISFEKIAVSDLCCTHSCNNNIHNEVHVHLRAIDIDPNVERLGAVTNKSILLDSDHRHADAKLLHKHATPNSKGEK